MGWSIGYDDFWKRDIGYGVPALCDHPGCNKEIDRGLGYVCGEEPYGGEEGCGLFFCSEHSAYNENGVRICEMCAKGEDAFEPKPDVKEWIEHKLNHESWEEWRKQNPDKVEEYRRNYGL